MHILLVRTSAIGDVIQTFPVLEYLHRTYPQAKIDWVVEQPIAPLLEQLRIKGFSPLHRVLVIDTKRWRKNIFLREIKAFYSLLRAVHYDLVFDCQGNTKSA